MSDYRINKFAFGDDIFKLPSRPLFGNGFGVCNTSTDTIMKTVSINNFTLTQGGIVTILFNFDVIKDASNVTLKINNEEAKVIYYRNSPIYSYLIQAGDLVSLIYDGNVFHIIAIDRKKIQSTFSEYQSGDIIVFHLVHASQLVTSTRKRMDFTLQVDRPIASDVTNFTINDFSAGRFCWGGVNNEDLLSYDSYSNMPAHTFEGIVSDAGLSFRFTRSGSNTWTSSRNNYTYIAYFQTLTVTLN